MHKNKDDRRWEAEMRLAESTHGNCGHMHTETGALRCTAAKVVKR